jgi:oxygen-independent coproporphyrinogen-3 oxidase
LEGRLHATRRHRAPEIWAERVERSGNGLTADELVPLEERAREALLMGLRLAEGIDLGRFLTRTGRTIMQSVDAAVLTQCIEEGYLVLTPERLIATRSGRIRLDSLLALLVA